MLPVEVATDEDAEAGAGAAAALLVDLEQDALEGDRVVPRHDALLFMAEDLRKVVAHDRHERAVRIHGRPAERRVVLGNEVLAQVPIRSRHGAEPRQAELIDEPTLQRAVGAFTAPAGLGREADNVPTPSRARARPTCVSFVRSGAVPEVGVVTAHAARSV